MSAKLTAITSFMILHVIFFMCVWSVTEQKSYQPENTAYLKGLFDNSKSNVVKSMGCHVLPNDAMLVRKSSMMTSIWCTKRCWEEKTHYAYVKGGKFCFCFQGLSETALSSECNIPCRHAKAQTCGGKHVASAMFTGWIKLKDGQPMSGLLMILYTSMLTRGYTKTPTMAKNNNGKCISWKPQKKVQFSSLLMTKEICLVHCFNNQFVYAGLSTGKTCTCTSETPPEKKVFLTKEQILKEGEKNACTWTCKGNTNQTCGGRAYVHSVWLTGHFKATDGLYKGYYIALPPLQQNWTKYLVSNPAILKELTLGKGVMLKPPPGVSEEEEDEADVEIVEETSVDGAVPTSVIVGCVLGTMALLGIFIIFTHCRKRKKTPLDEEVGDEKKGKKSKSKDTKGDKSPTRSKPRESKREKSPRRQKPNEVKKEKSPTVPKPKGASRTAPKTKSRTKDTKTKNSGKRDNSNERPKKKKRNSSK